MNECIETDVLILGSGIAGGIAAILLAEQGVNVTLVTRNGNSHESNTYYAQGGIIYKGKEDSPALLAEDIKRAGDGLCNPAAVDILSNEGPESVKNILIDQLGVPFDRDENGELSLVAEGGHSVARIIHATDATGRSIQNAISDYLAKTPNIHFLKNHTAVDLLAPHHHSLNRLQVYEPRSCIGAYLLDQENKIVIRVLAKKTILATGGLGQIYLRTTNPAGARGDGVAMAYRMGARVINNQFIQFHPTTFFHPQASRFLISEAVRGAGARLVNENGETFMQNYNKEWKDLAPRDIVSRSIHEEILKQGTTHVYLDLASYLPASKIKAEFPNIYKKCLDYGLDITSELIPVVPAAHYACGGVWVDNRGRTTINSLYAVGEVACTGLHGANRLASTSLLEGLVWARHAAQDILETLKDTPRPRKETIPPWQDEGVDDPDPALINQDMSSIKNIMWNYVGLVRNHRRLQRAIRELRNLENEIEKFYRKAKVTDSLIGIRNAVRTAIIIANSAWEDRQSRGCHFRES
jgi:L-aspartate oxidase